jgi:hypothetical protein
VHRACHAFERQSAGAREFARGAIVALTRAMLRHSFVVSCLIVLPLAAGCSIKLGDTTDGQSGKATFAYEGQSCFFGCAVERSIMVGSSEPISIKGKDGSLPAVSIEVENTEIARVTDTSHSCCTKTQNSEACTTASDETPCQSGQERTSSLRLQALHPGSTKLVLRRDGDVYDQIPISVASPARIEVKTAGSPDGASSIVLQIGHMYGVSARAFGADGQELQATTGFQGGIDDLKVAGFADLFSKPSATASISNELFATEVVAIGPGSTKLVVGAGDARVEATLDVK